jgi:hypothetical protein
MGYRNNFFSVLIMLDLNFTKKLEKEINLKKCLKLQNSNAFATN